MEIGGLSIHSSEALSLASNCCNTHTISKFQSVFVVQLQYANYGCLILVPPTHPTITTTHTLHSRHNSGTMEHAILTNVTIKYPSNFFEKKVQNKPMHDNSKPPNSCGCPRFDLQRLAKQGCWSAGSSSMGSGAFPYIISQLMSSKSAKTAITYLISFNSLGVQIKVFPGRKLEWNGSHTSILKFFPRKEKKENFCIQKSRIQTVGKLSNMS